MISPQGGSNIIIIHFGVLNLVVYIFFCVTSIKHISLQRLMIFRFFRFNFILHCLGSSFFFLDFQFFIHLNLKFLFSPIPILLLISLSFSSPCYPHPNLTIRPLTLLSSILHLPQLFSILNLTQLSFPSPIHISFPSPSYHLSS